MNANPDTLVPSRRLIYMANNDEVFEKASKHLGLYPQKIYTLLQTAGIERTRRVCVFILSILEDHQSFFYIDKNGKYDASPSGVQTRARNCLISLVLSNKPILEKYAGKSYFARYPKQGGCK